MVFIASGAVLTAIAAGMPLWQQHLATAARADAVAAARSARAAMRVALEDALDPFVHPVGRLADARGADKARLRGAAIQLAVTTVRPGRGTANPGVFFLLDAGPPRRLRAERFAGRAGPPTMAFVEDTGAGAAALRLVSRGGWTYHPDTAQEPPRFWWDNNRAQLPHLPGRPGGHTPTTC